MLLAIESAHMRAIKLPQDGWRRYGVKPYPIDAAAYRGAGGC
jgi:hypothetical protein